MPSWGEPPSGKPGSVSSSAGVGANEMQTSHLRSEVRMRGGVAYHELGFNRDFRNVLRPSLDSVDHYTGSDLAHLLQGLPHGREWRIDIGGALNIIEAYDRHVVGHTQAGFLESAYGTNGRNIVVGKQRGERLLTRE